MVNLIAEDIKNIHDSLEQEFPLMEKGILKEGLIQAAVEKQDRTLFGSSELHQGHFTKAAVLMEAITRWHIFVDGNKRTGLMSAFVYLYVNKIFLTIPINAVQFTVKVAETKGRDEEDTNQLIKEIEIWLKEHSAEELGEFTIKVWKYTFWPVVKLMILSKFGFKKRVEKKVDEWFATEFHPEYALEAGQVAKYVVDVMQFALKQLLNEYKKSRKKELA